MLIASLNGMHSMTLNLSTNYGGLQLRSPIIVGSCPMTANPQNWIAMENAGAGAIVLPSLFEEHIVAWRLKNGQDVTEQQERLIDQVDLVTQKALMSALDSYLSLVSRASTRSSLPVIASLNGTSDGDWFGIASELQAAGADAIELNIQHGTFRRYRQPHEREQDIVQLVRRLRQSISVPLFLKLHREHTSLESLARQIVSGVQGLVLFTRDPEIDISLHDFKIKKSWGLSSPSSISPALEALISVHAQCPAMSLAGSGGITHPEDVIKVLLAGADTAMIVSAVYRHGPDVIRTMRDGLIQFMESNRMQSLNELQSRRPIEFSSEDDRRHLIGGISDGFGLITPVAAPPTMECDRWGHLMTTT